MNEQPSVLVTGAGGFIGSALVRRLAEYSFDKIVASTRSIKRELPGHVRLFIVPDLSQDINWLSVLREVNVVVHCAGRAHVLKEKSREKAIKKFYDVNISGTIKIAEQAAEAGVKRFIFISSIGVNGHSTDGRKPFTENDEPAPHDDYAVSKYEAELRLRDVARESGMELVIIRPTLVYGKRAPGNFGMLVQWVRRRLPLPFALVRHNRRSFIALDNLVDLIIRCIVHQAAANQTFLAADGEDLSTAGLLERVGSVLGKPTRLIPVPVWMLWAGATVLGKRAVAQRLLGSLQVDISKTREVLSWEPPIGVDEGLRRAVGQYRADTML